MTVKITDLTGNRYGRYVVLRIAPRVGKKIKWICRCDCGTEKSIDVYPLKTGIVTSCGCYMRERNSTHGGSGHPLFQTWKHILERCYYPNDPAYKNYGARGIVMSDEWKNSPKQFYMDMGPRPNGMEIDRIDNNGPYSKENCRWATCEQQANNRRSNRVITFNGKTQTLMQWSKEIGVKPSTLQMRIGKYNWPLKRALTSKIYPS